MGNKKKDIYRRHGMRVKLVDLGGCYFMKKVYHGIHHQPPTRSQLPGGLYSDCPQQKKRHHISWYVMVGNY